MDITTEQSTAIKRDGRVIVSAAAGSGKTFVMMQKLIAAIEEGVDLDSVLAVTFTKKAAAQMKEKLRNSIIKRIKELSEQLNAGKNIAENTQKRERLKRQLPKVASADISTIHSFCARVLRTYFYAIDIDGTFDIMASDDATAKEFKRRAISALFERYYDEDNREFKLLLSCYKQSRRDEHLRELIFNSYDSLQNRLNGEKLLEKMQTLYTDEGFAEICGKLKESADRKYRRLIRDIEEFELSFKAPRPAYMKILEEMVEACKNMLGGDIFAPQCPFSSTRKPAVNTLKGDELDRDRQFQTFKEKAKDRYDKIRGDLKDEQSEKRRFIESGKVAGALAKILSDFKEEYDEIKREENKLDYNDLEHKICALLNNEEIAREIRAKYLRVFVDEYQDVNEVQAEIISKIGGKEVFLVGDIKQSIYGFRGSESRHFRERYEEFGKVEEHALKLSKNFRSSDGVLNFVNGVFTQVMTKDSCGIDYKNDGRMEHSGLYPEGYGTAKIHIFGEEEEQKEELGVYSVEKAGDINYTPEALAVLKIVEKHLNSKHYDIEQKDDDEKWVGTQQGDICILTRKNNKNAEAVARILLDAGYSVSGAQGENIADRPEVRQMVDMLSYIDNSLQDIPLATALLSPLGKMNCDELANIKVRFKGKGSKAFRDCCALYAKYYDDTISKKLRAFTAKMEELRSLAEVFTAAEMIDKILEDTNLEAEYSKGDKLKNIRRLAAEGEKISVSALLAKLKSGYEIKSPSVSSSGSIKLMTMHASKGLEFPVVIILDICSRFKGRDEYELPLNKEYGFAPKCFEEQTMLTHETVLRKLTKDNTDREELENELNLFYVACTRAKCDLHILAEEKVEFNPARAASAQCYADLFDMKDYSQNIDEFEEIKDDGTDVDGGENSDGKGVDTVLYERINSVFAREYAAANSVNLPVKSSASAILKMNEEDTVYAKQLFGGEGETSAEQGIAYHRFLELCDFKAKDRQAIESQRESFLKEGLITKEQYDILNVDELTEIVNLPIFATLDGATLYREQEFLCMLPANEIMDVQADDKVLLQGAIDLLAKMNSGYKIIDYKYSHKSRDQLIATYSKQLALYKKAVAVITKTDESKIQTVIVNISRKEQINL